MKPEIIQKRNQIRLLRKFASSKDEKKAIALVVFAESLGDTDLDRFLNPFCVLNVHRLEKSGRISDFSIGHKEIIDTSRRISPFLYNALWELNSLCLKYHLPLSGRIKNAGIRIGIDWIQRYIFFYFKKSDKILESVGGHAPYPGFEDDYTDYDCFPLLFVRSKDFKPHVFMSEFDKPGEKKSFIRGWVLEDEFRWKKEDEETGFSIRYNNDFIDSYNK